MASASDGLSWRGGGDTSRALAHANPEVLGGVLAKSNKTVQLKVGYSYSIVWNSTIERDARIEKLVKGEDGTSTVYFSIPGEKWGMPRKMCAFAGEPFKNILLEGGEKTLEL